MIRPRWYKIIADLWGNKVRSLLVIASIAIGLFAVGMIASMHAILREDMGAGYSSMNPANIQISASYFDDDLVERIRNVSGVRQAEGVHMFGLQVMSEGNIYNEINIIAIPEAESMEISKVKLDQGVWPPGEREIVVERHRLGEIGAGVGGNLTVELWSGNTRQLKLVGTVQDQTIGATRPGGFFMSPIQGYISLKSLEWLEQPELMNTILVTVEKGADDQDSLEEMVNKIVYEIEDSGKIVSSTATRASDDHPNSIYVQAITNLLFLLGFLVLFLSAFLITNTLSAILNQQIDQIGIMKTIGARRSQIIIIYMILILVFSLTAFVIAAPLSGQAAYLALQLFGRQINVELQGFRFVPSAILMQLGLALIVPQAAGILPIIIGTRISAVEAFSGFGLMKSSSRKSWVDNLLKRIKGLSRPQLISLRNTFRNRGRLILTLLTLTLGGAIFISTFNVHQSLNEHIARIGKYFLADINLTLGRHYRIQEIEDSLSGIDGIGEIEGWGAARSEVVMPDGTTGESITLLGPPADSAFIQPVLFEGRWVVQGDRNAVVLSERFQEEFPDLNIGDVLPLKVNGKEVDFIVIGFFQFSGKSGGFLAYTTYEYLSEITGTINRANSYRIQADSPRLSIKEQTSLGQDIENRLEERGYSVADVSEGKSLTQKSSGGLNALLIFLLILASLTAIVGSIGLTGTMSLNVLERTREIGVMRAIGASNQAVMGLVIVEGAIIGLLSWLFGMLLAFPISSLLTNTLNLALFNTAADFTFTPIGVVLWLFIVIVLSVLASVIPARSAARLTIREVLSYE